MATTATTKRPAKRTPASSPGVKRRGFASMDPAEQRRIASSGGKASHATGKGHKWTREDAVEAGRKGGLKSRRGPAKPKA